MIIIEQTDPRDPQAVALLEQSHALMRDLFPPEDNSFLEIDELCVPSVTFFTARDGAHVLGTAALAVKGHYGEVKSMFVSDAARGKGVGAALLRQVEDAARDLSLDSLKLETGRGLDAAHRLYRRYGFVDCEIFGDYTPNSSSIYMEKQLA